MNAANLFDHAFKYRQDLINITERCNKIDIINRFGDDVSVIATTLKLLQFDITTETGIEWREEVVDIFEYLITPVLEHIDINTDEFKQALHDQLLNRNNPISLTIMTRLFDYIKSLNTNNLTIDKILVITLVMSLITNIPEDSINLLSLYDVIMPKFLVFGTIISYTSSFGENSTNFTLWLWYNLLLNSYFL